MTYVGGIGAVVMAFEDRFKRQAWVVQGAFPCIVIALPKLQYKNIHSIFPSQSCSPTSSPHPCVPSPPPPILTAPTDSEHPASCHQYCPCHSSRYRQRPLS